MALPWRATGLAIEPPCGGNITASREHRNISMISKSAAKPLASIWHQMFVAAASAKY